MGQQGELGSGALSVCTTEAPLTISLCVNREVGTLAPLVLLGEPFIYLYWLSRLSRILGRGVRKRGKIHSKWLFSGSFESSQGDELSTPEAMAGTAVYSCF